MVGVFTDSEPAITGRIFRGKKPKCTNNPDRGRVQPQGAMEVQSNSFRLVHLGLGDEKVGGSNPLSPTPENPCFGGDSRRFGTV